MLMEYLLLSLLTHVRTESCFAWLAISVPVLLLFLPFFLG